MLRIGVAVACALALAGCAREPKIVDRDSFLAEASRTYPGETRERIIRAAETVLKLSDPGDFEFRHRVNGFVGLRRWFVYAVIASASGVDKWDFSTEMTPQGVQASISISGEGQTTSGRYTEGFEGAQNTIALYRVFWQRVEYVLGRNNHWVSCEEAWERQDEAGLGRGAMEGLCGITSQGRDAPPPPQLTPLPAIREVPPAPAKRKR